MDTDTSGLVEYGIQTEDVDWRVHVCFATSRVYMFRPQAAIKAIEAGLGKPARARQNGQLTARGWLVRPEDIEGCEERLIPPDILARNWCNKNDDESHKGAMAVNVVIDMIYAKHQGFLVPTREETGIVAQRRGQDVLYFGQTIQVKCDYSGGPHDLGGTGNLFLQTHEANPHKKH